MVIDFKVSHQNKKWYGVMQNFHHFLLHLDIQFCIYKAIFRTQYNKNHKNDKFNNYYYFI
jgi:hypothetical protein